MLPADWSISTSHDPLPPVSIIMVKDAMESVYMGVTTALSEMQLTD